jgi:hypothetical protein
MELSEKVIHDVIHPTAAFCDYPEQADPSVQTSGEKEVLWQDSRLNPKNRIDSLEIPQNPLWDIDGCTSFGHQFYVTPRFVASTPPLRVDLIVSLSKLRPRMREWLDVDVFFHTRDKDRIAKLGLTRYLLRVLHYWASSFEDPSLIYQNIPFGSHFSLGDFHIDIHQAYITIQPANGLEQQLLSPARLASYWGNDVEVPALVDINEVVYLSQIHDSVCLIEVQGRVWIFKALTSYSKYLYHELRNLLRIKPHPNVISRPAHLITKRCRFGEEIVVAGFTTEYQTHGSLRDLIPFLKLHRKVTLADMAKWSVQLASALVHLRQTTKTFYPDLRLDNIVLSASNDIVMVDFEQRGVWCEFAAPEVNAIEYVRLLAVDEQTPQETRNTCAAILTGLLPGWEELVDTEDRQAYEWPSDGYNIPWKCLTPAEHEYCEVYMLGRVLWCIFEAKSAPQRAAVWLSYRWEPVVEFPDYTITPEPMRDLIDRCTRGRQPGLSKYIVRERNQLVLRQVEHTGQTTAKQVQETAKQWWAKEIEASMRWLEERKRGMRDGTWKWNYYDRPSLKQVHAELEAYYRQVGGASA